MSSMAAAVAGTGSLSSASAATATSSSATAGSGSSTSASSTVAPLYCSDVELVCSDELCCADDGAVIATTSTGTMVAA